jgi:histidine triad (HIT) family protein
VQREEFDMTSYFELSQAGCFVCAFLDGDPNYPHTTLYDDGEFVAFLNRFPTLRGQALVVPRRHVEHVLTDLAADEYGRFMAVVRRVGLAMHAALPRTGSTCSL